MHESLFLCGWAICGVVAYGLTQACFTKRFIIIAMEARKINFFVAAVMGLMGPFGLLVNLVMGDWKYGFMFKPITYREWRALAVKKYPEFACLWPDEA